MGIIKVINAVHEYFRRNQNGDVVEEVCALDDVSLEIEEGEFISILGHNGSGKSTFAKHLNALLTPQEGVIYVNKMDTREEKNIFPIRENAGMVFQNPDNQIIGTIVEEDVGFGPENIGVPTKEIWERVEKSLKAVGMEFYREASPNKLSGGQKQRVAIAGVVAMRPKCIILDEPTAMLDPKGRKEVIKTIRELNEKEKITIILITHNMEEVVYSHRVFVMNHGKIIMNGTPREIFSRVEELKEAGLTIPVATEIAFELRKKGIPLSTSIITREELVEAICQLS
ncbi:MAG: energy-coupling factor transporter ATPase [Lachnospiraceae bacterium]|nr:energy-coupling factor transporter ATPase [Lachnospiraceae bacterium]MEE1342069.1 energy-coupling factor transporter ATPase [Lachnospiraceae bacterium]MEE1518295.1 energy-coupling factor transporter ATPase [Lachnospiraceae bacterium]